MQALYQLEVQGADLLARLPADFFRQAECDDFVRTLAWDWTRGAWENLDACDEWITSAVIRWQFSRLSPVDRSILRLSVYQLRFCPDIPPKVVINEAIELAKKFSGHKSSGFVNGVLDSELKRHRDQTEARQEMSP